MANHGFVTTHKWMNPEQIEQDILEILERRFKGKLAFAETGKPDEALYWWEISPSKDLLEEPWVYQFTVQLTTRRKLEFRHPPGQWPFWAQAVVQTELAVKYEGTLSDEGIEDRWKPDLKKFPTYSDWVKLMSSHMTDPKGIIYVRNLQMGSVPEPLKGL